MRSTSWLAICSRPDDVVFVDDPGYYQTFGHMRVLGATIRGVPWTAAGPDLERLESMAQTQRPRFFITTSIVHNPTGHSISQGTAFRLLQLAERYDFHIIEDRCRRCVSSRPSTAPRGSGRAESGHLRERLLQGAVAAASCRSGGGSPGHHPGPCRHEAADSGRDLGADGTRGA